MKKKLLKLIDPSPTAMRLMKSEDDMSAQERKAWDWILKNWTSPIWISIPCEFRAILRMREGLGVCHGSIVTAIGAKGINQTIAWLNRERKTS